MTLAAEMAFTQISMNLKHLDYKPITFGFLELLNDLRKVTIFSIGSNDNYITNVLKLEMIAVKRWPIINSSKPVTQM